MIFIFLSIEWFFGYGGVELDRERRIRFYPSVVDSVSRILWRISGESGWCGFRVDGDGV